MATPHHLFLLLLLVDRPASRRTRVLLDLVKQAGDRVPAGRGWKDALAGGHRVAGILPLVAEERVIPARTGGDLATIVVALAASTLAEPLPLASIGRFHGREALTVPPQSGPEFGMGQEDLDGYLDALVPRPARIRGRGPGQVSFRERATLHGPRFTLEIGRVVRRLGLFSSGLRFCLLAFFFVLADDLGLVNHRRAVRVATYPSIRIAAVPTTRRTSSDVHFEGGFFEMEITISRGSIYRALCTLVLGGTIAASNRGSPRAR